MALPLKARVLIWLLGLGALAALGYAQYTMSPLHGYRWLVLLALALVTARLKVKLPGLTGNMAVSLPFLLIAVTQLSLLEALFVALPACAAQCFPKGGGTPKLVQVLFNLSAMALAVTAASLLEMHFSPLLGAAGFFLVQTGPVAAVIHFTQGGAVHKIWAGIAHQTFPFYVLSAGITSMAASPAGPSNSWQLPLLGLPVLYGVYRSYESYFRVEELRGT